MPAPQTEWVTADDGYALAVRAWRPPQPRSTAIMLHGVVSHAGWLDNIASRLSQRGVTVLCPDRRGSGANRDGRGDTPSAQRLLDDLDSVLAAYTGSGQPLDLVGFCWGASYVVNYLSTRRADARSLILLAPAIFPARSLVEAPLVTGESGEATLEPNVPIDAFTTGPDYQRFILPDPLRLRRVSPRLNTALQTFTQFVGVKLTRINLPVLIVLADADRITDNEATKKAFDRLRGKPKRLVQVPGEHGVQFDAPVQTCDAMTRWIIDLETAPSPDLKAVP